MVDPGHLDEQTGELSAIREVKERHEGRLLSMPGVISVGVGWVPDGNPAIVVGLDGHRPETFREIPEELEGYRVQVEVIGPIRAL